MDSNLRRNSIILGVTVLVAVGIIAVANRGGRHKHQVKLIKTKTHHVYVENGDGSEYEFFPDAGGGDLALPRSGSSSFNLPKGSWVKARAPEEEEVEEEEEAVVEESDMGQPEADSAGDIDSDSDGGSPADSGGGDSGSGDSGGDSGGGDGGDGGDGG